MDELERVRNTSARIDALGAEHRRLTAQRDDEIAAALAAGASWASAMEASGLSRRGIKLAVDRAAARE